nr:MAG TPA_asm: ParB protein [Caudoviricetes sp.]
MSELKFDPKNYRIHGDKNKRLIQKSLVDCGAGRSILIDKEDCIIAGNGVYEQAQELGLKVRIIESDGTELIAIKRTDLKTEDARRKALALADNYTSDTSVFDVEAILEDFTEEDIDAWEFSIETGDVFIQGSNDPNKEFEDLGEFKFANKDISAWKQIIVSFKNEEDFAKFAKLINQNLTEKTKSIFYPAQVKEDVIEIYEQPK